MQLNTDFYNVTQADLGNGLTVLDKIISSQINDGDLPTNEEWDLSLAPWIIGKDCEWFDLSYIIEYFPGAVQTPTVERVGKCFDDNGGTGYPFWFGVGGSQSIRLGWQYKNAYSVQNVPVSAQRNNNRPIVNFKYNELIYYWTVYINGTERNITYVENNWNTLITNNSFLSGFRNAFYYRTTAGQNRQGQTVTIESLCKPLYIDDTDMSTSCGYNIDFLDYTFPVFGGNQQYVTNTRLYPLTQTRTAAFTSQYDISRTNFFPVPSNDNWTFSGSWNRDGQYLMCKRNLSTFTDFADFKDWLCKQAAYLGTYFTFDITTAQRADLSQAATNPNVYLGEIDASGVTTGNYLQGTAITDSPQSSWTDPWSDSPWKGFDDDPTKWDSDNVSTVNFGEGDPAYNSNEFLMTEHALNELCKVLNYYSATDGRNAGLTPPISPLCPFLFGSSNPFEVILSVVKYPFGMIYNWLQDTYTEIVHGTFLTTSLPVGNIDITIDTTGGTDNNKINLTSTGEIYQIDWSTTASTWHYSNISIPYFDKYKCFLDFDPYCTAAIYIPFCGSIKIDPEIFTGKNITVDYAVSPLDGTCKAFLRRDDLIIDTLTGNIGSRIEINSTDEGARANAIIQANNMIKAQKQNKLKNIAMFATGSAGAAITAKKAAAMPIVSGALSLSYNFEQIDDKINQLEYQIQTAETPFKQIQSGGGYLSQSDEYAIKLIAFRPVPLDGYSFDNWGNYGATVGFACMITDYLSAFTGFTKCSTANIDGITATDTEKKQIFEMLKGGVFL